MADRRFEIELDRQFGEAPVYPDADLFAARVTERLDRGWTFRRLLIGGLGLAGGLIGAGQILGSGVLSRLNALGARSDEVLHAGLAQLPAVRGLSNLMAAGASMDLQILVMSAGLGLLAIGLFVTRAIGEI